jgi:hypothetical protein
VKSNSFPATKSSAAQDPSEASGATATAAPTMPIINRGFSALSASATRTSPAKDGVLVCMTQRSYCRASGRISSSVSPSGGASTSREPGTSAAGWASHVGYQKERISRFAW